MTIAVIGGGASGMMAAITAANRFPDHQVLLLERQARVGRKLLATGNGRCNLSNANLQPAHFHCPQQGFCAPALSRFDPLDWFHRHGLLTVTEPSGRVYPLSDSANSVLDVLRFALNRPNLTQMLGCEVKSVKKMGDQFRLLTTQGPVNAQRVIVACGGLAGTKLGGGMSGYQILRSLGHHCSKLHPALAPVLTEDTLVKSLKGIRADGTVRLYRGQELLAQREGEIQFTATGVSGPAVFELSRDVSTAEGELFLELNLLRDYSAEQIMALLHQRATLYPALAAENLLTGMLHNRLGKTLLRLTPIAADTPMGQLSDEELQAVVEAVTHFRLKVLGVMGMDAAQVTAGGIDPNEFDPETLESRLCPQLFACGEVLDVDGDCGGYNLHWAWASGHLAGLGGMT